MAQRLGAGGRHRPHGHVERRRGPAHHGHPRARAPERDGERRPDPAASPGHHRDAAAQAEEVQLGHRARLTQTGRTSGSGSITSRTAPTRSWYERMKPRRVRTVAPYESNSAIERPSGS